MFMHKLTAGVMLATLGVVGCAKESRPGGPGAAPRTERSYQTPNGAVTEAPSTDRPVNRPDRDQPADRRGVDVDVNRPAIVDDNTTNNKTIDSAATFTLKAPVGEFDLDRGERKDLKITIDRGSKFDQKVDLQFKVPAGLKVTPEKATIAAGETEVMVTIEADASAKEGEMNIAVTGVPATGPSTSLTIPVEVHAD